MVEKRVGNWEKERNKRRKVRRRDNIEGKKIIVKIEVGIKEGMEERELKRKICKIKEWELKKIERN